MLSDEEKKIRVKKESDIPFRRVILRKNMSWVMFRSNNYYRAAVLVLMIIQFIADIACLCLSSVRGIWTSWAINPILIICACFGLFGTIRIEPISLFIHAIGCYVGLFIIFVGCLEVTVRDSSQAVEDSLQKGIVWALHAPGILDLICALLTTFMAASLIRCCGFCNCCSHCCCLRRADDDRNNNVSPSSMEEGNSRESVHANTNEPAPPTTSSDNAEAKDAATINSKDTNEENFDDLDDEAKMLALQKKQQQQQ